MKALQEYKCSKTSNANPIISSPPEYNIWFDEKNFESIKAPEPKVVRVINKDSDIDKNVENQNIIDKIIIENEIQLIDSLKSSKGDIVLVYENK